MHDAFSISDGGPEVECVARVQRPAQHPARHGVLANGCEEGAALGEQSVEAGGRRASDGRLALRGAADAPAEGDREGGRVARAAAAHEAAAHRGRGHQGGNEVCLDCHIRFRIEM